jgi:tRNA modification GTPase
MAEFSCHGSPPLLRAALDLLVSLGARPAGPGEFTLRAFLNGKLTLDQAEGVAALIEARTAEAARAARRLLSGGLDDRLRGFRGEILDQLARLEHTIDFEEEPGEEGVDLNVEALQGVAERVARLRDQHAAAARLRRGTTVLLAGPPNVGKSTLLNRILGYERALVSGEPGTTRDYLEAEVDLRGFPVRFVDTAGLRAAEGSVERAGVLRTEELLPEADLVLWLAGPPDHEPPPPSLLADPRLVPVANKVDLAPAPAAVPHAVSARTGRGVDELLDALHRRISGGHDPGELVVLEARQAAALTRCEEELRGASTLASRGAEAALIASRLHASLHALDEISGRFAPDELLDRIFSSFCVGK